MARMDHVRSAHGHRNVRHPIQRVAEQSLFYPRYSVTTSGFPETQQPRPDHPTVGGGGASEDVETTYQVSAVLVTRPRLNLTKYIGPDADSYEHWLP